RFPNRCRSASPATTARTRRITIRSKRPRRECKSTRSKPRSIIWRATPWQEVARSHAVELPEQDHGKFEREYFDHGCPGRECRDPADQGQRERRRRRAGSRRSGIAARLQPGRDGAESSLSRNLEVDPGDAALRAADRGQPLRSTVVVVTVSIAAPRVPRGTI